MAEIIQLNAGDYSQDDESGQAGAIPEATAPPVIVTAASGSQTPAVPATGSLSVPRWVWVAGGAILFLGLVYVLQKQFVGSGSRRRRRNPSKGDGIERAKRQRMRKERTDHDND